MNNDSIKLTPLKKVVTLVSLLSGIVPSWAQEKEDLPKLVCAITEMEEETANAAIKQAEKEGFIKYYGPE